MKRKDEPVAVEVEIDVDNGTTFLTKSASNYRTHTLFRVGGERMELRPTKTELAMTLQLVGNGLLLLIGSLLFNVPTVAHIVMIIAGLGLVVLGGYLARPSIVSKVFDKKNGYFNKGPLRIALDNISALQVLRGQSRSGYYSYELNLVMRDGTRLNVISTGGSEKVVMQYAKTLSQFLDKPLSLPGM